MKDSSEPAWIEVVTEILISLLAQNNHLLRTTVGSVFSVLAKDLTQTAMGSLLEVISKKDDEKDQDEEEDEDIEEMEEEEEENEDEEEEEDSDSDEEADSGNSEDEGEESKVNDEVLKKISTALGDHAADVDGEESESDLEMDDIPDDELARLDEKLVEAFKALGGRKDKQGKKKEELKKMANMHFQLRVLELVDIYLNHSPKPELLATLVPALLQSLDYAVKKGSSKDPLIKRLQSSLGKISNLKFKKDDCNFSEEF